ncbi:MAG TPA: methyltransferase [Spirochaetota bacterium]|nr:methyltransferase [Spirochaetota bacterium]HPP48427.1 methyltransferase [Spirochaetota bacterium]
MRKTWDKSGKNTMTHTLTIQRYANNGYGIGFIDGKTVFVPYSAVGDTVAVTITRQAKNYCFASITDIITPSPNRITPQCPAFTHCGGCDFLHIPYKEELTVKKELFMNTLTHIGGLSHHILPAIELISGERFHYRSHATLQSDGTHIGFYKKDSHSVEPIPAKGCLLLHEKLNTFILSQSCDSHANEPIKIAIDAQSSICSDPTAVITEQECGITYERSVSTFFQANRFLRSKMLLVVDELSQSFASILDVGCGVGFFSIYLAKRMKGTGIDTNIQSIEWARYNAKRNNVTVDFHTVSIENYHPFKHTHECIIIDPPRQGISKRGRKTIVAMNPSCIIYVSCNPVTFARDIKSFVDSNYRLQKLYMIDMFPCTHHTEVIGLLTK